MSAPQHQASGGAPKIHYRVSVREPATQQFLVRCELQVPDTGDIGLDFATWTPGYVILWNYGQHVSALEAFDARGQTLVVRRPSLSRWVVARPETRHLTIQYEVRAIDTHLDLGFAQAYLDSTQAWYNGAALFPEVSGLRKAVHTVSFDLPEEWGIATAMRPSPQPGLFTVADYDELVDSPVQLGRFLRRDIQVCGVPVGIVVAGCDTVDMDSLASMIDRIVAAEFRFMGNMPIDRFLFLFHAAERGAGGLEHANATTISVRREEFFRKDSWLKIVIAHEFYHVWNAKRIHPRTFDLYDYSGPHRTGTVWFAEGVTAYYTDLLLHRAGLLTREEVYRSLAGIIDLYENNPAHSRLSWEDISRHIWDPEILHGLNVWLLPGWMIDLVIRDSTDNRFSLDDVMRFMDSWYGDGGYGFEETDIPRICTAVGQRDFSDFFRLYIAGANSFPYDTLLSRAGLHWKKEVKVVPDFGFELWWSGGGRNRVTWISDTSAAFRSGIRRGDILTAVDGRPCETREQFRQAQNELRPGQQVPVTMVRSGKTLQFRIPAVQRATVRSEIVEIENPTPRQTAVREGILFGTPR
jgi:predicted metalloprotease with PDZ domain